jgi:dUTP pyrophosphatase
MALPEPSNIQVYKIDKNAILPSRANKSDAGLDIHSLETVFIPKGSTKLVSTGISIKVPEGFVGKLWSRSSLAKKGMDIGGGVIDAGFSGHLNVVIHNITSDLSNYNGENGYWITQGDKIAQFVLIPIMVPHVYQVNELWKSERGDKGWGSSGT